MSRNMKVKWRIQNAWLAVLIAGLIWSVCTVYELPVNPVSLFLWMGVVWGVLLMPPAVQGIVGFPLIVYVLFCFTKRESFLTKGWAQLYAGMSIRYHVHMKLPLPDGLRSIPGVQDASLLLKAAGVLFFVILAYACRRWLGHVLTLLLVTAVIGLELYHGRAPEIPAMICIFSGSIGLVSFRKTKDAPGGRIAMQLVFLTAALCAGGLILGTWGDRFLSRHKEILSRQKQIEKQIVEETGKIWRRLSGAMPGKTVPGKEMPGQSMPGKVSMQGISYQGSEVMKITTGNICVGDKYLRGFVGNAYRDGQWSYDEEPFERWQNTRSTAEHPAQYIYGQQYYKDYNDWKQYWLIDYLNTPDDFAYLPYGCDFMELGENVKYHYDGSVERKEDTLMFEVNSYAEDIPPWFDVQDYTRKEYAKELEEWGEDELDMWNNLSLSAKWLQDYYFDMVQADVNLEIPEDVEALFEKYNMPYELYETLRQWYLQDESDYWEYEYEWVPEEGKDDKKKLAQMRKKLAADTKISMVQKYLQQHTAYTKKPNEDAEGDTVLEKFLFTGRTGYCVHFATAGAMLLRYLGVPARYVTGYRVSSERYGFEKDSKYHARVLDSDAHAWVEIYDTTQGWVPVDFTDGVTELDSISPSPAALQTDNPEVTDEPVPTSTLAPTPTMKPQETAEVQETPAPSDSIPGGIEGGDGTDGNGSGGRKTAAIHLPPWGFKLLCGAAGLAVLFLMYFAAMKLRGQLRKRKRYQKDSGQAVLATTWQMMTLLRHLGIKENASMTDMAFAEYVETSLDIFEEGEFKRVLELAQKAAYCDGGMDREDAYFCRRIYDKVLLVCAERCHMLKFSL